MTGRPLDIRASSETESLLLRLHDMNIGILSLLEPGTAKRSITSDSEVVKHERPLVLAILTTSTFPFYAFYLCEAVYAIRVSATRSVGVVNS